MIRLIVMVAVLVALSPARAQDDAPFARVIAALNQNRIAITAGFDGSEIFVYGAIARERLSDAAPGDLGVLVTIVGPSAPVIVRRKERTLGIWINRESATVSAAPSFYAVATTGPFYETISYTDDLRYDVSLDRGLRFVGATEQISNRDAFLEAVVRLRRADGLYILNPGGVDVIGNTLFRTSFTLPANIVEGVYRARVLLTRERDVIDVFETEIDVAKAGIERAVFDLAQQQPLIYGLLSILVALLSGYGASEFFRYVRR
jgi:uncharacterized protein (TIGR02186 family)